MLMQIVAGAALGLSIALVSHRLKLLSSSGAAATVVLATVIYGFGGWKWTAPIFTFFLLSSFLSRLSAKKSAQRCVEYEKTSTRDALQVAANGGVGGVLVILTLFAPSEIWYLSYLGSIAAVTADTWGTEIGAFSSTPPRNILTFAREVPGASGAVSWPGTTGGLAGAVLIASVGGLFSLPGPTEFLLIITAGLLGSFVDSILGTTVQAQYQCAVCEQRTERRLHCQRPAHLIGGFRWMTNDIVNLSCATTGAVFMLLASYSLR